VGPVRGPPALVSKGRAYVAHLEADEACDRALCLSTGIAARVAVSPCLAIVYWMATVGFFSFTQDATFSNSSSLPKAMHPAVQSNQVFVSPAHRERRSGP